MNRLTDRLSRLEMQAAPPAAGKHLVFRIEAPHGTPAAAIVAFLRERGHAIRDEDEVFVMNVGAYALATSEPIRDLSPELLTEQARAAAPAGGEWPMPPGSSFTFKLDNPRALQ
ncbi:hypothetical protein [Methylobacterium phyllostachyos]|nr:hypothetical protein [Methylobacterium phyllostachyos]